MKLKRIIPRYSFVFLSSLLLIQCGGIPEGKLSCGSVQILSNELAVEDAIAFCAHAKKEREKVDKFWGETWRQQIRIHVSSKYRISKALIPGFRGNRGFMEMPLNRVENNNGALLHEIVHIYAPNQNRFLAEGLAVYLHEKLAGNPAFPNESGGNFNELAKTGMAKVDSLEVLNSVRTPRPLQRVMDGRTAYSLAGSFVGFLIEKYGLPIFKELYEDGNYKTVYGKSLLALEKEWRLFVSKI